MKKTFDQLRLTLSEDELVNHELTFPSQAYRSYFVLEPITHQGITRVSVTARDENMNVLWGSMVCEGHLPSGETTPVALYSAMRTLIRKHLQDTKPVTKQRQIPMLPSNTAAGKSTNNSGSSRFYERGHKFC